MAPAHDGLVAIGKLDADLLDDGAGPGAHHQDAVGEGDRLDQIVRDEERGLSLRGEGAREILLQDHPGLRVERRERLVHQQHQGIYGQRAGKRRALAHAAGELVRVVVFERAEMTLGQQGLCLFTPLYGGNPSDLEPELGVLADRAPRQQQILLQHERDLRARPGDALAGDADLSGARQVQPRAHVEQGRLAAAAWPDERDHFALVDRQVHVAHRLDRRFGRAPRREDLADVPELDRGAAHR
jgi:hypothetical protein